MEVGQIGKYIAIPWCASMALTKFCRSLEEGVTVCLQEVGELHGW